MSYIKVWCEYDFAGSFGGNNNEEIFTVSDNLTTDDIEQLVLEMLTRNCSMDEDELDGFYSWSFTSVESLGAEDV